MTQAQRTMNINSPEIMGNKTPDFLKASQCGHTTSPIKQITDCLWPL